MPTDAELMEIELETLWMKDGRGRLTTDGGRFGRPAPDLVIAVAKDGQRLAIGCEVPDAVAVALREVIDETLGMDNLSTPPVTLTTCRQRLALVAGPVELSSGPTYLLPHCTQYPSNAEILRSDGDCAELLRGLAPEGANWAPEEWRDLIDGTGGPWAVVVDDGRIVALCHSARLTDRGAEAGVWTAPSHRRRGLAAAVTAAWSHLFGGDTRRLFYSTSADNFSSQRVAARLRLREIGWTWQLSATPSA